MSENTPPKAGQPGSDSSEFSSSDSFHIPASPASPAPQASAPATAASSDVRGGSSSAAPGSPAAQAAARASSDTLESASAVAPAKGAAPHAAQEADAAEARASAAQETAAQEAAAHDGERAGNQSGPPPGFGAPPDFESWRPPPAGAAGAGAPPTKPAYLRQNDSPWSVFGRTVAARARRLFDRAGQRITQRTLRIGVSARIFHPEPGAMGLRGKTLQYLEESVAHWVMSRDVMVFMIPTVGHQGMLHPSNIRLRDYAKHLDGLLLQGGADVSPQTYAATEARAEWPGDRVRDMYELELLHEFVESGKPVLGVCRGCQLINVAFGGTLYQDIATEVPTAGVHVNERYDQHRHSVRFPDGSSLSNMFPGRREAIVNSIHHQAVKTLGRDLSVEAVSSSDGLIEAVRYRRAPFVMGVQWHPEFHRAGGAELLDCTPLLDSFLRAARETRF
ncbi:gamma-glutamyl-gamma-aminobutyrate hydrolase family protein [Trinickia caryophylli]|uniref:Gamma-glutamyl-gamma-aminobutyrate hydrolase PuuD (Putrescine degradation), contains GATase1-like domain n=2 Tax=Trinickia caryophylli TaxID=28094 RepID=A0A1X7CLZ1_TRICW|nr:type 1 glutamine amidotransferase [Trinickia caryophylli]PMS11185.1 peptidase C26 [Trinickia caryophylli]TRX20042.1 peptidase C26 [Trinickia caryophylli]WQE12611.1 gamma-glutamyl-gamma-aminobutyrate hydrolase family protein [Trinickia caryophylli]SME99011.1 Gamma-glutamyl-gamma-aminobutyrate hydrolase PuuD (putrescine degradation), contains GATase1-like domain [Trinickia caryophylli]